MPQLSPQGRVTDAQRVHGDVKILPLLDTAADSTNIREDFINRCLFVGWIAKFAIPYRLIDHKLYVGLSLTTLPLVFQSTRLSDELIRIRVIRKHQDFHFQVFSEQYFNRLFCSLHTRIVAIIIDHDFAGKPSC